MTSRRRLTNQARLLAACAAFALVLAPAIADARPGGGSSGGSRGSRTYSAPPTTSTAPSQARPMDRTMTQPLRPAAPVAGAGAAGAATPARAGGFGMGLMGGIAGGLLGAGLFGMLTGQGFMGGIAGLAGMLGFLLQIGLIAGLVYLVVRMIRRRAPQPAMAGMGAGMGGMARTMDGGRPMPQGGMGGGGMPATTPVSIGPADFAAFQQMLVEMNAAWSRGDVAALKRIATPEMVTYFANDLKDLAARGWHNETRDVSLDQGDLSEAWREGNEDYATVAMKFSMIDVTTRLADGAVVEGDPARRQTSTELWTFVRQGGGAWRLSAIQQAG
ncbi:Tim44 domain-containing protein [Humitalea sp. 24SJ18S-53]|uniref:Tim44 domain-containing protein n=1 Tax=Humitalea sp. 24SJ18S-53 TaxID=3422307 RepID=UPI003D66E1C1